MHFFRRSKIHLDCFINHRGIIEASPIDYAIKYIPEWWRALPKERLTEGFIPSATMKTCRGMYDYYAKSVCVPMWTELAVKVQDHNYIWQFSDEYTEGIVHSRNQYAGFTTEAEGHLKIKSPWFLQTKDDIDWVVTSPTYSSKDVFGYSLLPGLLNFKYQNSTNLQVMINLSANRNIRVPCNTPMALLTPMSDKKVVVHRHLISQPALKKIIDRHATNSFINKHNNHKNAFINKCPYKDHIK